jgi:hypothetical protein
LTRFAAQFYAVELAGRPLGFFDHDLSRKPLYTVDPIRPAKYKELPLLATCLLRYQWQGRWGEFFESGVGYREFAESQFRYEKPTAYSENKCAG